ncbi:MAG TPA: YIP1 family protein, partial [Ktedonobacteraceae bacterium]|nr:YIP1 family protein [Ktedonobacteraceae bacterium]
AHRPRADWSRLPIQYAKAIFRPFPETFRRESEFARWSLVWLQLALLIAIPVIMSALRSIFRDSSVGVNPRSNVLFAFLGTLVVGATVGAFIFKIILIPILFFIGSGIQYVTARLLRGHGRYLAHGYSMLLYEVPLTFIGGIIITGFVLAHFSTFFFTPIITLALFIYGLFINVSVVMGVHGLNRSKAIITVLVPYAIGFLVACGVLATLAHYIVQTFHTVH